MNTTREHHKTQLSAEREKLRIIASLLAHADAAHRSMEYRQEQRLRDAAGLVQAA